MNWFRIPYPVSRIPKYGFTLVEIMVTTMILSLGLVWVFQAFFISLDSFNYYSNYLKIAPWMENKIWQTQADLNRNGTLANIEQEGNFKNMNRNFAWHLSYGLIDQTQNLYKIDLVVLWQEGRRKVKLSRSAYVMYKEK